MDELKRARLKLWLIRAYHGARTPAEHNAIITLFIACGFGNPDTDENWER